MKHVHPIAALALSGLALAGLAACGTASAGEETPKQSKSASTSAKDEPRSSSSNKRNAPVKDVTIGDLTDDGYGMKKVAVNVTNHSSKVSDYSIHLELLDASGKRVDETYAGPQSLGAGQKATEDAAFFTAEKGVKVKITKVERWGAL